MRLRCCLMAMLPCSLLLLQQQLPNPINTIWHNTAQHADDGKLLHCDSHSSSTHASLDAITLPLGVQLPEFVQRFLLLS